MRAPRLSLAGLALVVVGCGSNSAGSGDAGGADASVTDSSTDGASFVHDSAPGDSPGFGDDGPSKDTGGPQKNVTSIAITPATATLVTQNGGPGTLQFQTI